MALSHKKYKIYILGDIPPLITMETIHKFSNAESQMHKYSVKAFNPLTNLLNSNLKKNEAFKRNIHELTDSNAIYLLDEENEFYSNSIELKLAFALNLTVIHEPNSKRFDISGLFKE
jgi:hypothetical protein